MLAAVTKAQRFYSLSLAYLYRHNPFVLFANAIREAAIEFFTQNKKKKVATYRVNHLKYRLYQMEQMIEQGNPYNFSSGKKLDKLQ